jgi:alkylhydroperoxidase family enzyme
MKPILVAPIAAAVALTACGGSELNAVDAAVIDLAEKVAVDATRVTQGDVDHLRSLGLSDAEIFDIVIAAAARCFFSKALDGLGIEADSKYAQLDPELRDALTVGRSIAEG